MPSPRSKPPLPRWQGSPELERGTRLAIDVGSVRVGVARSDPDGILAVPEVTLARDSLTMQRIGALVEEHSAAIVYVGLPLGLDGQVGTAGALAEEFAAALARSIAVPVHLVDERLSTVSAQRSLQAAGKSTRESRAYVDQAAAVVILDAALARERADGTRAGRAVTV